MNYCWLIGGAAVIGALFLVLLWLLGRPTI
jgi:hypothetical protein